MNYEQKIKKSNEAIECSTEIHPSVQIKKFEVEFRAPNCKLIINQKCKINNLQLYFLVKNTTVIIGEETLVNSRIWANLSGIGTTLRFGPRCLIASVRCRTSDCHHIIDLKTNNTINRPGDIIVDERVWIAEDVLLLRNAKIGSNSVIGARSLVNSDIPSNSLAVGTPARVIKNDISWRYSGKYLNPPTV